MTTKTVCIPLFLLLLFPLHGLKAQDASLSLDDIPSEKVKVKDAFNGPQVILCQSTNMLQAKRLDLVFGHRFGKLSEGAFNAFGLDQGFIRIGAEYGLKDWLTVGLGRSSLGKNWDGFVKYRPLIQTKGGERNIPFSWVMFLSTAISLRELKEANDIHDDSQFVNQLAYTFQNSVSRLFSTGFSLQASVIYVHKNSVQSGDINNNLYGVGMGGRVKLTERIHLLAEYNHMLNNATEIQNTVGLGMDVVAGGHVFNIHITNSVGIIEKEFLTTTKDQLSDLRLGFTIRRSFLLKPGVEGGKVKY